MSYIYGVRSKAFKILVTKAGSLNAQLAKWLILFSQYDIIFVPQTKAVKGHRH